MKKMIIIVEYNTLKKVKVYAKIAFFVNLPYKTPCREVVKMLSLFEAFVSIALHLGFGKNKFHQAKFDFI